VLRIAAFRRLWITLALSSLGDWLGLLATAVIAADQVTGPTAKGAAFGGVVVVRLLPALLLGPLAGVFADRFDRRLTMVVCDVLRFVLFASIPLAGSIGWTLAASFLIEVVGMFWIPAKEASVPNLVRRDQLETANQLSLFTTYGLAPIAAAGMFAALATVTRVIADKLPAGYFAANRVDLALYFNAATFLLAAIVVVFIPEISGRRSAGSAPAVEPGLLSAIGEGWTYVRSSALIRGLVLGIFGALSAGGIVVGTGKFYASALGGGDATFGLLFGSLFVGLGAGMGLGPKLARDLSRRRWFGMSIVLAGASVALLALAPFLALAVLLAFLVGLGAGMAYLAGITLLGGEVDDQLRGRIFAFVQSMVRVVLLFSTALASVLVGLGGEHTAVIGPVTLTFNASRGLLLVAGLIAVTVGVLAFRHMDDRRGVPVLPDLYAALRGQPLAPRPRLGLFVAFEGGEGAGKTTQIRLLADWLAEQRLPCLATGEPGGTALGRKLREALLDPAAAPDPRAEALLYAADRADHVARVVRPALERGDIVLSDRYVDSSLAYQGAGRELPVEDVARLSRWATQGLRPDLVVLLDVDPAVGLARARGRSPADRLEGESLDFHERVRRGFRALADGDPRHLVVDASGPPERVAEFVRERVARLLAARSAPPAAGPQPEHLAVPVPDGSAVPRPDGSARQGAPVAE